MPAQDDLLEAIATAPTTAGVIELCADGRARTFLERALRGLQHAPDPLDVVHYLPVDDFDALVPVAIDVLRTAGSSTHEVAGDLLSWVSLQAVEALHPRLRDIWELAPNAGWDSELWPWRAAPPVECAHLAATFDSDPEPQNRRRAWLGLVETRTQPGLEAAMARAAGTDLWNVPSRRREPWPHMVGLELQEDRLVGICSRSPHHLVFEADYLGFGPDEMLGDAARAHPTWFLLGDPVETASFGGSVDAPCALCGQPLHQMIGLPSVPQGSGVTSRTQLTFATCLSCLGWVEEVLQFVHDDVGRPTPVGVVGEPREPEFPADPFPATTVALVPTPRRWQFQNWGFSNGEQNLHRFGGEPTWIQGPEYPTCASCASTMHFVFQLDSELPFGEHGPGWLWGSGGIAYFFWCDQCAVSASLWQCT